MKRRTQTPQQRHHNHPAEVRPGRGPHAGEIYCVKCNRHIQWISQAQLEQWQKSHR